MWNLRSKTKGKKGQIKKWALKYRKLEVHRGEADRGMGQTGEGGEEYTSHDEHGLMYRIAQSL